MNNPSFELGSPDEALVERFNTFVAEHAGRYALGNGEVQLTTYNYDPDNNPSETGYVIGISETIGTEDETFHLDTEYHSRQGSINKSVEMQTREELEAGERRIQQHKLELAVESALIGDDDPGKALASLVAGKLSTPEGFESFMKRVEEPGPEEYPVNTREVTQLLDEMRNVVDPERLQ